MTLDLDVMVGRAERVLRDDKTMGGPGPEMANAVLALAEELRQLREAVDTYVLSRAPAEKAAE